jgi:hypothetical protein
MLTSVTRIVKGYIFRNVGRRYAGHVARMGEKSSPYRILVGKPEDLDVGVRIILKWILER